MTNETIPQPLASDPPEDIAALNATAANINQRVELLGMADLIDDLYVWLTNLTGTPESDILEEARAVMWRYKTRHHDQANNRRRPARRMT